VTTPDGCATLTSGETTSGIQLNGTHDTVRDSIVDGSAGNGILVDGSHNTVTNDIVMHADLMGSYAAGINVVGPNETVTHNTVAHAGRSDINIDWKVAGPTVTGESIGYNDLSDFNNLVSDGGALYVCCGVNLAGSEFDHNVMHNPAALGQTSVAPGIYLDLSTFNATAYDNVTYGGTNNGVVLINGDSSGDKIDNNTAGDDSTSVALFSSNYPNTDLSNNIGDVSANSTATEQGNLAYSTNPLFTSPATHDYTLTAQSPARAVGVPRPPATDGYRDPHPDAGAYQYGVAKWTAGATVNSTLIQAERYTNSSGVARHAAGTGTVLGNFDGGDWVEYTSVDFGQGRDWFTGSIGEDPAFAGRQFQIRADSLTGPVLGTVTVAQTGGFDTYTDESTPITFTSAVHDVYLVALGSSPGVANLDYFSLDD
jgi:hypothetical protein